MPLNYYKLLAAGLLFIVTIIAVAYPIKARTLPKHHHLMDLSDAFASGIFLGAALFHMLPDANTGFQQALGQIRYPLAELFCASGFVLLLLLERLAMNPTRNNHLTVPYLIAGTLMVHSLIEGAALGMNMNFAMASAIFVAIFVHKGSESFALSVSLCRGNHLATRPLIWIIGIFALMTPLGIGLGATLTAFIQFKQGELLTAGFNAFAAGTFLYMSTLHHIHHHQRAHAAEGLMEFACLLSGLVIMGLVVMWV